MESPDELLAGHLIKHSPHSFGTLESSQRAPANAKLTTCPPILVGAKEALKWLALRQRREPMPNCSSSGHST